ncbi:MAG TPA: hypothetical protein VFU35_12520 [Jatrophihabitans sp.]|nr:hypothetical protein [Jatrophihabitans sp.]
MIVKKRPPRRKRDDVLVLQPVRTLSGMYLVIHGSLDIDAAEPLGRALAWLETDPDSCGVSLQHVDFADTWGLDPIVESIRRSIAQHRHPVRICAASYPVRRVFDCLGVRWQPVFDLAAWDAADSGPPAPPDRLLSEAAG